MRLQYLLHRCTACVLSTVTCAVFAQSKPVVPSATPQPHTDARSSYALPVFNTTTRNVILDVLVMDSKGIPVAGLTRNDFTIREDNTPQETKSFESVSMGISSAASSPHTILLVDEMNTRFEDMAYTRYSVDKLIKHGAAELDQPTALYLLSNDGLHVLQDYTRDAAAIDAALRHHKAVLPTHLDGGVYSAADRINLSLTALQQIAIANMGGDGHKNIVWVSAGLPIFSALEVAPESQRRMFDAIRRLSNQLLQARISIYSVDPRGIVFDEPPPAVAATSGAFSQYLTAVSSSGQAAFGDIAIQTLAKQTGGHAFYGRNDVDREIAASIADGNTYYTLTYAPSNRDFRGEFRKVKISVAGRPELKVQTRDGYYAVPDGQPIDAKRQLQELVSSLSAPLAFTGIRIPVSYSSVKQALVHVSFIVSADSLSWTPDAQGRLRTTISVAAADQDKNGQWQERIGRVYSLGLPGGVAPTADRTAEVSFDMPYHRSNHVRFVVRDDASGRIGSSEITLSADKKG